MVNKGNRASVRQVKHSPEPNQHTTSTASYEPSDGEKRRIMFNRELEENYQEIRRSHFEALYGALTPEEEAEWLRQQSKLENEQ